jgi:ferredoxin-thioredoxin reductase catalytic subunit
MQVMSPVTRRQRVRYSVTGYNVSVCFYNAEKETIDILPDNCTLLENWSDTNYDPEWADHLVWLGTAKENRKHGAGLCFLSQNRGKKEESKKMSWDCREYVEHMAEQTGTCLGRIFSGQSYASQLTL